MQRPVSLYRKIQWATMSATLLAAAVIGLSYLDLFRADHERSRFMIGVLDNYQQQLERFTRNFDSTDFNSVKGWPDDFLGLQTWLISQWSAHQGPKQMLADLRELKKSRSFSPKMASSMDRWEWSLTRWIRESAKIKSTSPVKPGKWLAQGRMKFHEASGYQRLGRLYDATPLYLWAIEDLTKFLRSDPNSSDAAEAFFLIGESYIRLRHALPEKLRGDRILSLCGDIFPGSIWARRANLIWRNEMTRAG